MIDVLVVGGGPAGLATAIGCSQAGLSVVVAEPRPGPIDKACGEGLMPSAVERLARLGVRPVGRTFHGIRYLDAGHQVDARFRTGHGLGVRRTALHDALAHRASDLGVTVLPRRVTSVVEHADRVCAAGVQARYLVGADGLHSVVRRLAGLEPARPHPRRPGDDAARRFGLRQHLRVPPWSDLVEVYWAYDGPGSEAYVTPVAQDLVGVAVLGGPHGDFRTRLAAFPRLLQRLGDAQPDGHVRGAGPLRHAVPARRRGRVLLVGDASGYLDALTGEGIGMALAQAESLVSCLASGRAADYDTEWARSCRTARALTGGLLWARQRRRIAPWIVPAAQRLPRVFSGVVNLVGHA